MKKLTIIGDIMCEPPVCVQAERENGYDFMPAFEHLKGLLSEADFAIGNFEAPLGGKELGYTVRLVSFNAPEELARTIKDIGIGMVTTANNHACDRGNEGIVNTVRNLDAAGLSHTGSYVNYSPDDPGRIFYRQIGDTKIAMISYTYGTNYSLNKTKPDEAAGNHVNYLKPVDSKLGVGERKFPESYKKIVALMNRVSGGKVLWEDEVDLRNAMGIPQAYADDILEPEESEECLRDLQADYEEARRNADLVFVMPHMGGQFNVKPGAFSNYMVWRMKEMGFDGIFAAHSHTLQKAEVKSGVPVFWSLGNVSMAPFSPYAARETLPEYAVAAHLYLEDGEIAKTAFSLTKIIEEDDGLITVYPLDELYEKYKGAGESEVVCPGHPAEEDVKVSGTKAAEMLAAEAAEIYRRVTGRRFPGICREYEL